MPLQYAAMESACSFSFEDLFWSAHGRPWSGLERDAFMAATQSRRNMLVRAWAARAGDVHLTDRPGTDGQVYAAFCFERPAWWGRLTWASPRPTTDGGGSGPGPRPGGAVVAALAPAGGPLVPRRAIAVTHDEHAAAAIDRLRPEAADGSVVHLASGGPDVPALVDQLGAYLRCPVR